MDSNTLEREKGITKLASNTAIMYKDVKVNIIDTPGHADFSEEVKRVINMADGCLLLIHSVEGPMPQTKFVFREAFKKKFKIIVVINKIDRQNARIPEVLKLTQDLFLELATDAEQLDFPVLYASGREGVVVKEPGMEGKDVWPLFETILEKYRRRRLKKARSRCWFQTWTMIPIRAKSPSAESGAARSPRMTWSFV